MHQFWIRAPFVRTMSDVARKFLGGLRDRQHSLTFQVDFRFKNEINQIWINQNKFNKKKIVIYEWWFRRPLPNYSFSEFFCVFSCMEGHIFLQISTIGDLIEEYRQPHKSVIFWLKVSRILSAQDCNYTPAECKAQWYYLEGEFKLYNTVKPPISGQPSAWKKSPLLGGVRYWGKGHIFAVEGNEKHYSRMFRSKFKNIFWLSK